MITINQDKCIGCGKCVTDCFPKAISIQNAKAVVNNNSCMKCGHCIAVCPQNAVSIDEYNMSDVKEYDAESFSITPDKLLNFIQFRRSIRQFKNMSIEQEKLEKIIEAGRFTQTGSNMQDVSYTVVSDQLAPLEEMTLKTLKNIGETALASGSNNINLKKYASLWLRMWESYQADPIKGDMLFFHAPSIIAISADSEVNAALAASNMELMADALGLGTFFSGFFIRAAASNPDIGKFINLKEGKKLVCCMVIGYPAVSYQRTVPRKAADITWK